MFYFLNVSSYVDQFPTERLWFRLPNTDKSCLFPFLNSNTADKMIVCLNFFLIIREFGKKRTRIVMMPFPISRNYRTLSWLCHYVYA